MSKKSKKNYCSFCGRSTEDLPDVIASPNDDAFICPECVEICHAMTDKTNLKDTGTKKKKEIISNLKVPIPAEIKKKLDKYVIAQDGVKKTLSVAVHNHYKRLIHSAGKKKKNDVEIEKSNVLLLGKTGTGKTLVAKTLAKILDVPFAISDATTLTEAGYVGEDVENIILRLVRAADYNIEKAQIGIIYIDEIDKIGRRTDNVSITRDVSGEGVQQALLKIIEGTIANIPPKGGRKHPEQEYLRVDTSNILFICGGAFVGIDQMIQRRIGTHVLGFHTDTKTDEDILPETLSENMDNLTDFIEPEDLLHFGLIPELIGRLPIAISMRDLKKEDLISILTEPKNALVKQFKQLFVMQGVKLHYTKGALEALAEKSIKRKTGARGLRSIMEKIMMDVMYDLPSKKDIKICTVDKNAVIGKAQPKFE
ncbi:MAG: ATP-dependent Clp protease ATP-binding subunit ClpX [Verrucomicrobiota bacterium]|nr:ATP-dependent Clp protease ATP-binding subunit ClpX [Verrucomicrobiota bacterium]